MSTEVRWNSSGSRALHAPTRSRWAEIERGLKIILASYLVLVVLAIPGAVVWATAQEHTGRWLWLGPNGNEDAELFGLVLGLGGALGSYLLALIGQWRCLSYAPQDHSAKELMFVSLLTAVVAAPLAVVAPF